METKSLVVKLDLPVVSCDIKLIVHARQERSFTARNVPNSHLVLTLRVSKGSIQGYTAAVVDSGNVRKETWRFMVTTVFEKLWTVWNKGCYPRNT
jgi:hypothetical protein